MNKNQKKDRCLKCGYDLVSTRYVNMFASEMPFFRMGDTDEFFEHLQKKCGRCGYIWNEETVDKPTDEIDDDAGKPVYETSHDFHN